MVRFTLCALGLFLVGLPVIATRAQPTVSVKARAQIDELKATVTGRRVRIEGGLVDNLGHAVGGQNVEITLDDGQPSTSRTDGNGRFRHTINVRTRGTHRIQARFTGTALLAGADETVSFLAGRRTVSLSLNSNPEVRAERPVSLRVRALTGDKPAPNVLLRPHVAERRGLIRETDGGGRATLSIPALPPGIHEVIVEVVEDEVYRGQQHAFEIESMQPTPAALHVLGPSPPPPDAPLSIEIRFGSTPSSAPPARVTLTLDGEPEASQSRVEGGLARFIVPRDDLSEGLHTLQGTVAPLVNGWANAVTPQVTVRVPPAPPPSVAWQAVPLGLSLVALLALGVRWRPIQRPVPIKTQKTLMPPTLEFASAAHQDRLSVTVIDGLTDRHLTATVVPGSTLPMPDWSSTAPPGERLESTPEASLTLPATTRWVWCAAVDYAPVIHRLPAEGGHATVRLLPPRAHAQRCFGHCLNHAGMPALEFGRESPRQAGRGLVTRGADPATVARLIDAVEAACFGVDEPEDGLLSVISKASIQVSVAVAKERI